MTHKQRAIQALENSKGDDLHRARMAFIGLELDEQHGQSGKTRRQILAEYEEHNRQVNAALEWLRGVPE